MTVIDSRGLQDACWHSSVPRSRDNVQGGHMRGSRRCACCGRNSPCAYPHVLLRPWDTGVIQGQYCIAICQHLKRWPGIHKHWPVWMFLYTYRVTEDDPPDPVDFTWISASDIVDRRFKNVLLLICYCFYVLI